MQELKYHINSVPASAKDIIEVARDLDEEFSDSGFYQTSVASRILREHGISVGYVTDIK